MGNIRGDSADRNNVPSWPDTIARSPSDFGLGDRTGGPAPWTTSSRSCCLNRPRPDHGERGAGDLGVTSRYGPDGARRTLRRRTCKARSFRKDWRCHEAVTDLTLDGHNSCWPVRTSATQDDQGRRQPRSPAMAAG